MPQFRRSNQHFFRVNPYQSVTLQHILSKTYIEIMQETQFCYLLSTQTTVKHTNYDIGTWITQHTLLIWRQSA